MTIKQQIKHRNIEKLCHLHNSIFNPIQLRLTLSILKSNMLFTRKN